MKYQNGSVVSYNVKKSFVPQTPDQLKDLAVKHGVPESIVPAYAGDKQIAMRAVNGTSKTGWQVKGLDTGKEDTLVYTIAAVSKDAEKERTDYYHEATVRWSGANGNGHRLEGWHELAQAMNTTYQELRGKVLASDWTENLISYITGDCQGVSMKEGVGGVWWVPPQGTSKIEALRAMLAEVGITLWVSEIDAAATGDLRDLAQDSLASQLTAMQKLLDDSDGSQSSGFYGAKLEQVRTVRQKLVSYEAALGLYSQEIKGMVAKATTRAQQLMQERLRTVIHKDGTRETAPPADVSAQLATIRTMAQMSDTQLARALERGELVIDVDLVDVEIFMIGLAQQQAPRPEAREADEASLAALATVEGVDEELAEELSAPVAAGDIPDEF